MTQLKQRTHRSLASWRRAKRLSQAKAAELLGMTQSHYSKLERGLTMLPGPKAKRIMEKTTVPLAVLVGATA